MLVILCKMMAGPCKMTATPHVMLAATYLTFAKDKRGGLEEHPRPPHTPILEKTVVSGDDFLDIRNKKIKKIECDI